MGCCLISRADDFGSARSANASILAGLKAGYWIRNVSCMAPGKYMAEAAEALAPYSGQVNLGLHFTVNSEWDAVKWTPCSPKDKIPSLLGADGEFYQSSEALRQANPDLEQVMAELDAQLEALHALGLDISYVDGHMFPERYIDGLDAEMKAWAAKKGLFCANDCYGLWHGSPRFTETEEEFYTETASWLSTLTDVDTCLYIMHPAQLNEETMAFANRDFPSGIVAHERELEYRSVTSSRWVQWCEDCGISLLRFSDYA